MIEDITIHHYAFHDYLHWGIHISHVWFSWWRVDRTLPFLLTVSSIAMTAIIHESLSLIRRRMLIHSLTTTLHSRTLTGIGSASFLRFVEAMLSIMLILAMVTFNAWVILAIAVGTSIGYYLALSLDEGSTAAMAGYNLEPGLHH